MTSGWAEFNDVDARLRGVLVATDGTFSGKLKADSVEAVSALNIRDGAVSAYYGFSASGSALSFVVPAQNLVDVVEVSIPVSLSANGTAFSYSVRVTITKNGTVWRDQTFSQSNDYSVYSVLMGIKFFDFDGINSNVTYRVTLSGSYGAAFTGTAIVACRKR